MWLSLLIPAIGLVIVGVVLYFVAFSRPPSSEPSEPEEPAAPIEDVPDEALPESVAPVVSESGSIESEEEQEPEGEEDEEQGEKGSPEVSVSPLVSYPTLADMPEETVELLHSLTRTLPRLPSVALDLLPVLAQPGAGAREIAKIIERDQSTAARLLRWVNSSFYGLEGKVESLHRAVTLMGIDTVRSAVVEDALSRLLDPPSLETLSTRTVLSHGAAASLAAKHLARWVRGVDPEVAATSGLLHDIGLLLLLVTERIGLLDALKAARDAGEPLIAHEDPTMGFNHQVWGESFVKAWRLPDIIARAVGSHHSPLREPVDPLACVIWLADYMVSRLGFPCPEGQIPLAQEEELTVLMRRIGLHTPLGRYITEGLVREMMSATRLWGTEPAADRAKTSSASV